MAKKLKGDEVATPKIKNLIKDKYDKIIKQFIKYCLDDIIITFKDQETYYIDLYYGRSHMIKEMQKVADFLMTTNFDLSIKLLGFEDSTNIFGKIVHVDNSIIRFEASIKAIKDYMATIDDITTLYAVNKESEQRLIVKIADQFNLPYKHVENIENDIFTKFSDNVLKLIIKNRTYLTMEDEAKLGIEYVRGLISLDLVKTRRFYNETIVPALVTAAATSTDANAKYETYKKYYESLNAFVKLLNTKLTSLHTSIAENIFSGDYNEVFMKECREDYLRLEVTNSIKYPEVFMFPAGKAALA